MLLIVVSVEFISGVKTEKNRSIKSVSSALSYERCSAWSAHVRAALARVCNRSAARRRRCIIHLCAVPGHRRKQYLNETI